MPKKRKTIVKVAKKIATIKELATERFLMIGDELCRVKTSSPVLESAFTLGGEYFRKVVIVHFLKTGEWNASLRVEREHVKRANLSIPILCEACKELLPDSEIKMKSFYHADCWRKEIEKERALRGSL